MNRNSGANLPKIWITQNNDPTLSERLIKLGDMEEMCDIPGGDKKLTHNFVRKLAETKQLETP